MSNEPKIINVSDWKSIEIENIKFILTEGQSYFKFLSDAKIRITSKAFSIITILIPICSILTAYISKSISNEQFTNKGLVCFVIAILIMLLYILFRLGKIIKPKNSMPFGREPFELFKDERMLGINWDKDLSIKALVIAEIENTQAKIEYNRENNKHIQEELDKSMMLIGYLFVAATVAIIAYTLICLF